MKLDRLVRVMSVAEKIRKEPGITYNELAQEFDVSVRTVRRDVSVLEQAGLPVQNYHGLRFMSDVELPKVQFEPDEVILLLLMVNFISRYEIDNQIPNSLYEKLKQYLPEKMMDKYQHIQKSVLIHPHDNEQDGRNIVRRFKDIIECKNRVKIYYQSHSSKQENWRMVDPYGVFFKKRAWYMVGYCHRHLDIRIFKCNRIKKIKSLPDMYDIPNDFDLEEFLSDSFELMKGEPTKIKIKFTQEVASLIEETVFYKKEKKFRNNGDIIYELEVANWREVFSWVLSFGRKAEILEPGWMREKMINELELMKVMYD
ncbi:helix-turn-helix transcriptional regulator [Natranaerobius thermophilus]|uniref:Helix-turn-helix type 11 domain protein n=1 Tax=Natranaerobius thermophilus (strain ATCC BAA-1301 / DSM 18059 / JW/NM-WN-LF) TaxID=457570 RepID=B2A7V3_NATTJ|nr:transcriptional regulator [Natranaerobius thermophilus]ACB84401.1 Helix-turn-helix type 11 domain protein [Natranaerobius thermophilus JW/NM-WN-LF]